MALEKENKDFALAVNGFLSANRKAFLAVLGGAVAAVIGVIVFFTVTERRNAGAISAVETVIYNLEEFKQKNKPTDDSGADEGEKETPVSDAVKAEEDKAAEELKALVSKYPSSYAAFRGNTAVAELYFRRKNYEEAMKFYEAAAKAVQSYTAGIAYFNAAACADELADNEKALGFYKKASEVKDFPLIPRALFNVGRLYEALQKTTEAVEAYNKLSAAYPNNEWGLLAKSRAIAISKDQ